MGHARTIDIVNKKSEIMPFAREFAFYNTDRMENPSGSYDNRLTIVEDIVIDSFEEAEEYLSSRFQGYNDGAVQFRDVESIKVPKAIETKEKQIAKVRFELKEEREKNHFANHKSKFIGCPHCQSKINAEFVKKARMLYLINTCPVCKEDMRPKTVLDKLKNKEKKIDDLKKQVNAMKKEFQKKVKDKAKIKWAVKVEVHC